jgi:NADH:ubiquinone oxidoreductase subunit H
MTVIQEKPIGEVVAREPQSYPLAARGTNVAAPDRTRYLRIALRLVGLTFIVGIYTFVIVWPSGWSWHTGQSHHLPHYLQMILGVYATLGVFLLIASRNPLAHLSLIWFTVRSSVVHAAVMAVQALATRTKLDTFGGTSWHCLLSLPCLRC